MRHEKSTKCSTSDQRCFRSHKHRTRKTAGDDRAQLSQYIISTELQWRESDKRWHCAGDSNPPPVNNSWPPVVLPRRKNKKKSKGGGCPVTGDHAVDHYRGEDITTPLVLRMAEISPLGLQSFRSLKSYLLSTPKPSRMMFYLSPVSHKVGYHNAADNRTSHVVIFRCT
jgi:hypothetical protein